MHTCLSITFRPKGEILISLLVSVQLLWWITQTLKLNSLLQVWRSFLFLKNLCLGSFLCSDIRDGVCQSILYLKLRRSFRHRSPAVASPKPLVKKQIVQVDRADLMVSLEAAAATYRPQTGFPDFFIFCPKCMVVIFSFTLQIMISVKYP